MKDGFVPKDNRSEVSGVMSKICRFKTSPVSFLIKLLSVRNRHCNPDISHTAALLLKCKRPDKFVNKNQPKSDSRKRKRNNPTSDDINRVSLYSNQKENTDLEFPPVLKRRKV
eukprot:TRINITY_DN7140_c0_g1_i1.p2 TRINITY_DN7140_c0_g1~~TRINITY_DN7140_c0_g1_i1.p2  ORF type:complete len:113 (+),score=20.04 TRINITY_DN7140_c0_g1_i1:753-1091(+)